MSMVLLGFNIAILIASHTWTPSEAMYPGFGYGGQPLVPVCL
jgi:hypothetical protein